MLAGRNNDAGLSVLCDGKSTRHLESRRHNATKGLVRGLAGDDKADSALRSPKSHKSHVTCSHATFRAQGCRHQPLTVLSSGWLNQMNPSRLLVSRESGSTPRILKSSATPPQPTSDSPFTTSRAESPHPSCPIFLAIDDCFSHLGHLARAELAARPLPRPENNSRKHPTPIPSHCPLAPARPLDILPSTSRSLCDHQPSPCRSRSRSAHP